MVIEDSLDIICVIETREASEQLGDILPLTSPILVNRGDLSSEIGVHNVPVDEARRPTAAKKPSFG